MVITMAKGNGSLLLPVLGELELGAQSAREETERHRGQTGPKQGDDLGQEQMAIGAVGKDVEHKRSYRNRAMVLSS